MPFVLFLALLASATAAPTTKGRRANEQPKVRLVVTGETNVARTTRGARASNRVAQMAAWGGNVTMTIRAAHNTFTVVEVADPNEARLFKEQAERSGLRVEEDQRRYPGPIISATRTQPLAEETPWGIERVYNGAVPNASFFPSAVTHPLCIIDSGYLLTHPDLPSDATAADPLQADPAGTMYFGDDICNHGTHVLILSAALSATSILCPPSLCRPLDPTLHHSTTSSPPPSPPPSVPPGTHVAGTIATIGGDGEGVVGVFPGAPGLKIVKVFGEAGQLDDPPGWPNEACGWTYASELVDAVQRCVDSGAKIVSSERA